MKLTITMRPTIKQLLCLLWLCAATPIWADGFDLYIVASGDGNYTSLDMAKLRSLSFVQTTEGTGGNRVYHNTMTAHYSDGTSVPYDLANYGAIVFEDPDVVGIDDITLASSESPAGKPFVYAGSQLTAVSAGVMRIHHLDGRKVSEQAVSVGQSVSLQTLAAGFYIVSLNGQSAKIHIK